MARRRAINVYTLTRPPASLPSFLLHITVAACHSISARTNKQEPKPSLSALGGTAKASNWVDLSLEILTGSYREDIWEFCLNGVQTGNAEVVSCLLVSITYAVSRRNPETHLIINNFATRLSSALSGGEARRAREGGRDRGRKGLGQELQELIIFPF